MKKMLIYGFAIIAIIIISVVCIVFAGEDDGRNIEFLAEYGWEVEAEAIEKVKVHIPEQFDDVYHNYNQIQKRAGLDLAPYRGKEGVRYTYLVLNYPEPVGEPVRANLICIDGEPVAGDVMTVSVNGFMHSLNYPANTQKRFD